MRICEYCARAEPCYFTPVETEGAYCCKGYMPIFTADSAESPQETADKVPYDIKPIVYVASPYTHPDPAIQEKRFQDVCRFSAGLFQQGICAFSPIAYTHPIAQYGLPTGFEFYMDYDIAILNACAEMIVLMLDGWQDSEGVQAEIEIAKAMGLPIRYVEPEDNE